MRINYIILAHNNPSQLSRLIKRLIDDETYFYVHIDKKKDLNQFENQLKQIENIYFLREGRLNIAWGSYSIVEATLLLIKRILKERALGYCVLMSGQDYPIKSNKKISSFFESNYGVNFISNFSMNSSKSWRKKTDRLEKYNFHLQKNLREVETLFSVFENSFYKKQSKSIRKLYRILKSDNKYKWGILRLFKKRKFPNYLVPYGGSQWWALPIETIKFIDDFLSKNKTYINYHFYTHCADEIFFHSIICSNYKKELIGESITYVNWHRQNCKLPVTFKLNDLEELENVKNKLFARKFDENIDSKILDEIDKNLLQSMK